MSLYAMYARTNLLVTYTNIHQRILTWAAEECEEWSASSEVGFCSLTTCGFHLVLPFDLVTSSAPCHLASHSNCSDSSSMMRPSRRRSSLDLPILFVNADTASSQNHTTCLNVHVLRLEDSCCLMMACGVDLEDQQIVDSLQCCQ